MSPLLSLVAVLGTVPQAQRSEIRDVNLDAVGESLRCVGNGEWTSALVGAFVLADDLARAYWREEHPDAGLPAEKQTEVVVSVVYMPVGENRTPVGFVEGKGSESQVCFARTWPIRKRLAVAELRSAHWTRATCADARSPGALTGGIGVGIRIQMQIDCAANRAAIVFDSVSDQDVQRAGRTEAASSAPYPDSWLTLEQGPKGVKVIRGCFPGWRQSPNLSGRLGWRFSDAAVESFCSPMYMDMGNGIRAPWHMIEVRKDGGK